MDSYNELKCEDVNTSTTSISTGDKEDVENDDQLPVYFKNCESIFKDLETGIKNVDSSGKDLNIHFPPNFALYF